MTMSNKMDFKSSFLLLVVASLIMFSLKTVAFSTETVLSYKSELAKGSLNDTNLISDHEGSIIACNCGDDATDCYFDGDKKTCTCNPNFAQQGDKCVECDCGENSTGCHFHGDKKVCKCKEKFAQKGGMCEACDCGTTGCEFEGDRMICKEDSAHRVRRCDDCECGTHAITCHYEKGYMICTCKENYAQKGWTCVACDCGNGSTGCRYEDDIYPLKYENNYKKICTCKQEFAQMGDECEVCDCGLFSTSCHFDETERKCGCIAGFTDINGLCQLCDCGLFSTSCHFDENERKCGCIEGFTDINGLCQPKQCEEICGTEKDVICDFSVTRIRCLCEETKNFDKGTKRCRIPCVDNNSCVNEAKCTEYNGIKFCECLDGTSGDRCEIIDDCVTGKYKNCSGGDSGECSYNTTLKRADCICLEKKVLKDLTGYCDECDCGENSENCYFLNDIKTCLCKINYSENDGNCEECYCGPNSESCRFVEGQKNMQL